MADPSRFFEESEGLFCFMSDDLGQSLHCASHLEPKGRPRAAFFYEIRSADNTVLKRDGGFASQDAAKMAAREDDLPPDSARVIIRHPIC